jgi:hypothetical protein
MRLDRVEGFSFLVLLCIQHSGGVPRLIAVIYRELVDCSDIQMQGVSVWVRLVSVRVDEMKCSHNVVPIGWKLDQMHYPAEDGLAKA